MFHTFIFSTSPKWRFFMGKKVIDHGIWNGVPWGAMESPYVGRITHQPGISLNTKLNLFLASNCSFSPCFAIEVLPCFSTELLMFISLSWFISIEPSMNGEFDDVCFCSTVTPKKGLVPQGHTSGFSLVFRRRCVEDVRHSRVMSCGSLAFTEG